MRSAGFDEQNIVELQEQLREYISSVQPDPLVRGEEGLSGGFRDAVGNARDGDVGNTDMSTLDALLHDDDELDLSSMADVSEKANREDEGAGTAGASSRKADDLASGNGKESSTTAADTGISSEWKAVIEKYIRPPNTPLEAERQELLRSLEYHAAEDLSTEAELKALQRTRIETELLARARLSVVYEQKEAARRAREWGKRGVSLDSLPAPALELKDNSS